MLLFSFPSLLDTQSVSLYIFSTLLSLPKINKNKKIKEAAALKSAKGMGAGDYEKELVRMACW